jgi:hypothetical protein
MNIGEFEREIWVPEPEDVPMLIPDKEDEREKEPVPV